MGDQNQILKSWDKERNYSVLDSPPVLQNPASDQVIVTWAVKMPATGWVEYGPTDSLGNRADSIIYGQQVYSKRLISITLSDLTPGETIYYRIASAPVEFGGGSKVEQKEPEFSEIYQWKVLDEKAEKASFVVINDTHSKEELLSELLPQIDALQADFTVWNGDLFSSVESEDEIVSQVLRPAQQTYAAERPVLFLAGNHDYRGEYARMLPQAIRPWRESCVAGRCFAVRQGPLAMIGLDTAEDKPNRHPIFSGLAHHEEYREAQQKWLKEAIKLPQIVSAPYLIAFCHIPLWGLPDDNPGDILEGYAGYCRQGQQLWHPLLEEAGVQLLITGHKHNFRFDPPGQSRSYGQIVGGGPTLEKATFIHGQADDKQFHISVYNLHKEQIGHWSLPSRK